MRDLSSSIDDGSEVVEGSEGDEGRRLLWMWYFLRALSVDE
jgi:hypothetical protein